MQSALAIAGSDPTGGAGIQLDLQVFALHGVHGMAVPTALTVQTTAGVLRTLPVFPNVVGEQLTALFDDIRPDDPTRDRVQQPQRVTGAQTAWLLV